MKQTTTTKQSKTYPAQTNPFQLRDLTEAFYFVECQMLLLHNDSAFRLKAFS
jgi:hypothetical protein